MKTEAGWHPLRVRTLRTVGADQEERVSQVVFCPVDERSKSFAECSTCPDCEGIANDPEGKRTLVLCQGDVRNANLAVRIMGNRGATTPVSTILRRETVCIRPEMSVSALTNLLLGLGIGGVPVVDADGRPIGIVSRSDLLQKRDASTALDAMTSSPISISETMPISEAAAIMAFEGVHRLPVVGTNRACVGVLSTVDILRWLAREDGFRIPDYTQHQREDES